MNLILKTVTRIFYNGPYVWEFLAAQSGSARKIEELHEGSFFISHFQSWNLRLSIREQVQDHPVGNRKSSNVRQ